MKKYVKKKTNKQKLLKKKIAFWFKKYIESMHKINQIYFSSHPAIIEVKLYHMFFF